MSKWCFTCSIFCTYCFFTLLYIFLCVISFHLPPPSSSFFGEERGQGPGPGPIESSFFDVFLQCCVPVLFVLIYTQHLILTNSQVSLLRFILFEVQTLHRKESASARVPMVVESIQIRQSITVEQNPRSKFELSTCLSSYITILY